MDPALSELLICPRCGPGFGLVLLPHEVRDRRVWAGVLGCANCRERYPVVGGVADLGVSGSVSDRVEGGGSRDSADALRLAALLDLTAPGGTALLAGVGVEVGRAVAELVEVPVVVVSGSAGELSGTDGRVSVVRATGVLPFRTSSLIGVGLIGGWAGQVEEGGRVARPGGRMVVEPAGSGVVETLETEGWVVVAREGETLVVTR